MEIKVQSSSLLTFVPLVIVALAIAVGIGMLVVWCLLLAWNFFAVSAGISALVTINLATVFGAWLVCALVSVLFAKSKS